MASSPDHLQALMNALAVYCATLAMDINVAKVMVVSKPSVGSPPAQCGNTVNIMLSSYKAF